MNWTIFWGIILVLIGLSLIIKVVFNVELPLMKIFIGFFFIYLGLKIFIGKDFTIFSHNGNENENVIVFGKKTIHEVNDGMEYTVVFGKGIMDLRNTNPEEVRNIRLNTIFGSTDVLLNDTVAFMIRSTSAFGGVIMPDGNTANFGSINYESGNDTTGYRQMIIESNTVFGQTIFKKW